MSGRAEPPVTEAWRLLMGLVLDQRMRWTEVAAELGISQAGLRALLAIDPENPRPQRELAKALDCDPSYVTGMVDELERAGFALRRTEPADRRLKTIALTDAGVDALRKASDGSVPPPAEFARLPPGDQRELARILRSAIIGASPDSPVPKAARPRRRKGPARRPSGVADVAVGREEAD